LSRSAARCYWPIVSLLTAGAVQTETEKLKQALAETLNIMDQLAGLVQDFGKPQGADSFFAVRAGELLDRVQKHCEGARKLLA